MTEKIIKEWKNEIKEIGGNFESTTKIHLMITQDHWGHNIKNAINGQTLAIEGNIDGYTSYTEQQVYQFTVNAGGSKFWQGCIETKRF